MKILPVLALASNAKIFDELIWLGGAALICYVLWWLFGYLKIQEPFLTVIRAILAVAAAVVCIRSILVITGHT